MAESGQAFSLTEVSAANRGKNESRPTTRGSAVADLDIDSDQIKPYFSNVSTAVQRLATSLDEETAARKKDISDVRHELEVRVAAAEKKAQDWDTELKVDLEGQLAQQWTRTEGEIEKVNKELEEAKERVTGLETQVERLTERLEAIAPTKDEDDVEDPFTEVLELVRNMGHMMGRMSLLERKTTRQASDGRAEILQNRKRVAIVEAQLDKLAGVTGAKEHMGETPSLGAAFGGGDSPIRSGLSTRMDPNGDSKLSTEELANTANYSGIKPGASTAPRAHKDGEAAEDGSAGAAQGDEPANAEMQEWLRKKQLAPRRSPTDVVTKESMAMHCKDMVPGEYKKRMRAAVVIQRAYRRHLLRRNWPECIFEITAEEQRQLRLEAVAFAEKMQPIVMGGGGGSGGDGEGGGGGGVMDPNIVKKVNAHQRMLIQMEAQVESAVGRARKDREESRLLKDELSDYLQVAEKAQQTLGMTKVRVEATEETLTAAKKELSTLESEFRENEAKTEVLKQALDELKENVTGGGADYVDQEESQRRMDALEGQLMMLEKSQWNDDDEDDGNKLTSLEERVMKLSELVNKIGETSEEAHGLASTLKKVYDVERDKKKGSLEDDMDSIRTRVAEIYASHQTLSSSMHKLARQTSTILEKPDTAEDLAKVQGKLALLWKSKADKDEVDRAITRAVDTVMSSMPEPPGEHDGACAAKQTLSCLTCDRSVTKVATEDEHPNGNKVGHVRLRSPELLFGGGLARPRTDRPAPISGLDIPLQTDRIFPYTSLHQPSSNHERDLVGDTRGRAVKHISHTASPRQTRLAAMRGPGGFKPGSKTSRKALPESAQMDSGFDVQVKLQQGFKGKKQTMGNEEVFGGGYATPQKMGKHPILPTPPSSGPSSGGRALREDSSAFPSAWDAMPHTAGSMDIGDKPAQ